MARIGEVLLEHGWVDPADLRRALAEQSLAGGKRICSLLIARGVLDPDNAAKALSQQHGVPAVLQRHLENRDLALAELLPGVVARMYFALPIGRTRGGEIIVCVREPSPDVEIALRKAILTPIMIAVAPAAQLEELIDQSYDHEEFDVDLGTSGNIDPPSMSGGLLAPPSAPTGATSVLPEVEGMPEIGAFSLVELDDVRVNKDVTTSQAELKLPPRTTSPPYNAVTPPFGTLVTSGQPARQTLPPRTTPAPAMPSGPFASITPPAGSRVQEEHVPQDVDMDDLAVSSQPTEDVPPRNEEEDLSVARSATSTAWPPPDVRTPAPTSKPPPTRVPTTPPAQATRLPLDTPITGVPVIPAIPAPPPAPAIPPSNPPGAPAFAVRYSKPPITPPIRPNPTDDDVPATNRLPLPGIGRSTPPTGVSSVGRSTPPGGVPSAGRYSSTTPPTETPARYSSATPTHEVIGRGAGRYSSTTPPKETATDSIGKSTPQTGRYSSTTPPAETSTRYSTTKPPATGRHTAAPPTEPAKRPSDRHPTAAPVESSSRSPSGRHPTAAPVESSSRSPSGRHPTAAPEESPRSPSGRHSTAAPPEVAPSKPVTTPPESKRPAGKPSTTTPPGNRVSVEAVVEALADAVDGDSATDVAMRFASKRWQSSLLLAVKEGAALGQRGHGPQLSAEIVRTVAIPLESPSIVKAAHDAKRVVLEPPPDAGAIHDRVVKLLGQPRNPSAAAILVANRISHVFVVGDLADEGADGPADLGSLAAALGDAYTRSGRPVK